MYVAIIDDKVTVKLGPRYDMEDLTPNQDEVQGFHTYWWCALCLAMTHISAVMLLRSCRTLTMSATLLCSYVTQQLHSVAAHPCICVGAGVEAHAEGQ
jgi:Alpha-amylase C-terminal beta-sheet domain